MRRKVEEMQRQLLERKNKLRATEDTAEKKGNVVDKVNKILNMKVRVRAIFLILELSFANGRAQTGEAVQIRREEEA